MIRINLLPRKVTRKKATSIRHVALGAALVAVVLVAMGYLWILQSGKVKALNQQLVAAQQEKERLKNVNQEKEQHQKTIEDLKHRIDVITEIERGRLLPVRLMDDLTAILDETMPIWLSSLRYGAGKLTIDGESFTNPDIARFVKRLEESPTMKDVELVISQKSNVQNREVFKFSVTANLETPQQGI